jgi:hypothetical protein
METIHGRNDVTHFGCNEQTDRQAQTDSSILFYFILFKIGHLKIKKLQI